MPEINRRAMMAGTAALIAAPPLVVGADRIERHDFPTPPLRRGAVGVIRMAADTMSPRFEKGERIWFYAHVEPVVGDDAVIETDAGFRIGRVVKTTRSALTVERFNPPAVEVFRRRAVHSIGRVIRHEDLMV